MDLEKLRHLNQELLGTLRTNQEEFRRWIQARPAFPSIQPEITPLQDRRVLEAEDGKEHRNRCPEDGADVVTPDLAEGGCGPTAGGSPPKLAPSCSATRTERSPKGRLHPGSSSREMIFVPSTGALGSARETRRNGNDSKMKCRRKPSAASKTCSGPEKPGPGTGEELAEALGDGVGQAKASARIPPGPRAILLAPHRDGPEGKAKKEAGHVTFAPGPEERTIPAGDWSALPFLGYDWIAGLLDMDSSLADKPEQYFHELQDFRQVNRDDCIYSRDSQLDGLGSSATNRELETDLASHQCVFCYRLNQRLFAEPLGPEPSCPVCKTPRSQRPPETLVEPAFVRVSIPRSTLLPAYKHKIHRRKSYEATDNLALPSHCMAGWENRTRAVSPTVSSLDLRSSLDGEPSFRADQVTRLGGRRKWPFGGLWQPQPGGIFVCVLAFQHSASRGSGRTKTDTLLEASRAAAFELGTLPRRRGRRSGGAGPEMT